MVGQGPPYLLLQTLLQYAQPQHVDAEKNREGNGEELEPHVMSLGFTASNGGQGAHESFYTPAIPIQMQA